MRWTETSPAPSIPSLPGLPPLVAQLLARRGLSTPEAVSAFLDSAAYRPTPPEALPGLPMAIDRIGQAIAAKETIGVWGDFDVDGQTATTILVETLRRLGADVLYYIPVRSVESHGVHLPRLEQMIDQGVRLIVTCDTGISAHEAADFAHSRGVDMVITDHHDLPPRIPRANAVINPKMLPAGHPLSTLSGAGVAYKLAEALLTGQPGEADALLDLTALGLVADLAILRAETRYLVQRGLAALRATPRLGLQKMYELAEIPTASLNEEHIGFVLGPRLNALGRLGDANPIVELFTTRDPVRARVLAVQIENYNAQRQLLSSQVTQAAEAKLRAEPALLAEPVIILDHPSWPAGVVGIVANRLAERYHKPVVVFCAPPGEPARGSARSIAGINITAAIAEQQDLLLKFGGHPMAAGLALEQEKLPAFRKRLCQTIAQMMKDIETEPSIQIDAWLDLPAITLKLAQALEMLAPFGPGNEKPILASHNLKLRSATPIGRNQEHRRLVVEDEAGNAQTVLWWDSADLDLPQGIFDLAYTIRAAQWQGTTSAQLTLIAFRQTAEVVAEVRRPSIEIVDYRADPQPHRRLAELPAGTLIWAEGPDRERVHGLDRYELAAAPALAIWTPPPGPDVLAAVLEKVAPQTIFLFAPSETSEATEAFMARLAGLVKFAIWQRGGRVNYASLAAATAQREVVVRKGLTWMVERGKIRVVGESGKSLTLAAGGEVNDPAGAAQLWAEIQSLLAETSAYRAYFRQAPAAALIV
ncbi:MAG: single-stranded-DNA-specific exonuclease RecJ [Anaerolineales bacterium]